MAGPHITARRATATAGISGLACFCCAAARAETLEEYEQAQALEALEAQIRTVEARLARMDEPGFVLPDQARLNASQLRDLLQMLEDDRRRVELGRVSQIANGSTTALFPAVGALLRGQQTICSGTLVGTNSFLTARHCFHDIEVGDHDQLVGYRVYFQHAGFYRLDLNGEPVVLHPHTDLALVELETDVTGIAPSMLKQDITSLNSAGTIVGFGRTKGSSHDSGLKRSGKILTDECPDEAPEDAICWSFVAPIVTPASESNSCGVDSGGPLFVPPPPSQTRLAATIWGGVDTASCAAEDASWNVNVAQFHDWLDSRIPVKTASPELPVCCDDPVIAEAFKGKLQGSGSNSRFDEPFQVPAHVRIVRVAMNATEGQSANFELKISQQGSAFKSTGCEKVGQYAFCEFTFNDSPPANWALRVKKKTSIGTGTAQAIVTMFAE